MKLAIIPARGGSKRIPRKNIKVFHGKPIIAWPIQAAIASKCFDRIIVSTDDEEIAEVAKSYGAEVPFIRPQELSDDYTGTVPVVAHAIEWLKLHGETTSEACCIYATAAFIEASDLQNGLQKLKSSRADYAITVTSYPFPIQRAIRIITESRITMFQPEHCYTRSQDLEAAWHDAGQFYWGKAESWLTHQAIFLADTVPITLPRYTVHDLDTIEDWKEAEILFNYIHNRKTREK